jgi:hypothetical protein
MPVIEVFTFSTLIRKLCNLLHTMRDSRFKVQGSPVESSQADKSHRWRVRKAKFHGAGKAHTQGVKR